MSSDISSGTRYEAVDVSAEDWTSGGVPCRAVIINTAGVINGRASGQTQDTLTGTLPAGWHPIKFTIIRTSSTTAAGITAVW